MISQEEKWFETPTWNLEKTEKVIIKFNDFSTMNKIHSIVIEYFDSIGFKFEYKAIYENSRNRAIYEYSRNREIIVDIINKTISGIGYWEREPDFQIPIAYPSQVPIYMEANKAMLMGKKFGL